MAKKVQSSRNLSLLLLVIFLAIFGVVVWYNIQKGTAFGKDFLAEFTPIYMAIRNFFVGLMVRFGIR